ncbi:MAG: enoyl-CoA hydratase/isomerase family protein [Gammaproteobacteria bacterium]
MSKHRTFKHLKIERQGAVAWVSLNRPEVANALSFATLVELEQVGLEFRDDSQIRVIVLKGEGKHFSAGADLNDPQWTTPLPLLEERRRLRQGERAIKAIYHLDQITICAWQGAAAGGGACLTTATDFRIGANDCFMMYPEIDLGINLSWQSLPLIVNLVGPARAKRLVIGNERVEAQALMDWGILDQLVDRANLDAAAAQMAAHYVDRPPITAQMIKASVNALTAQSSDAVMHMETDQYLLSRSTEDRKIAVKAYLAKEAAVFKGN